MERNMDVPEMPLSYRWTGGKEHGDTRGIHDARNGQTKEIPEAQFFFL